MKNLLLALFWLLVVGAVVADPLHVFHDVFCHILALMITTVMGLTSAVRKRLVKDTSSQPMETDEH